MRAMVSTYDCGPLGVRRLHSAAKSPACDIRPDAWPHALRPTTKRLRRRCDDPSWDWCRVEPGKSTARDFSILLRYLLCAIKVAVGSADEMVDGLRRARVGLQDEPDWRSL